MLMLCKLLETDDSLTVPTWKVNQRRMACEQQKSHPVGTARENEMYFSTICHVLSILQW